MDDPQYLFGTLAFILIILLLIKPFRFIIKILFKTVLGALSLLALNFCGLSVGLNLLNAAIIGILGIPGIASVVILSHLF